jgi:serine/threonine protein kinase HipA of HipAB toxin-antitoxin module
MPLGEVSIGWRANAGGHREDVDRFLLALGFNWLIVGPDAHAMNYSLLIADNVVRLAPLYDIASALPYPMFTSRIERWQ